MNDRRMRLGDFSQLARQCRESGYGFAEFRQLETVHQLGWPDDVLEQWVFDHAENVSFLNDYGEVDLAQIDWQVEVLPVDDFMVMPTGPSDRGAIEDFAESPEHWVAVRRYGVRMGVGLCWEVHGTWKRWPIVLDRDLVNPGDFSLQLVEGRTRVGILRGRRLCGSVVADRHLAWVGRRRA